ncbi:cytochrome P450 [Streptomyces sp. NBC_00083]|uniref:cytochrome P450 n=1 Tax=Streptomyces sp. NBC_00083 TaxID=2975647 RepID=UPI0022571FE0|nr:cytochrome P450 [Streptomyces sp. NBC_00083]MCX5387439.1 cytochrome P450 [Streptomyces sp. NBC_00083]
MSVCLIVLLIVPAVFAATVVTALTACPRLAAAYRFHLLTKDDEPPGLPPRRLPDHDIHGNLLEALFAHESASHRGRTHARRAILYFHRPADEHQENIDTDHPRYAESSRATYRALAVPREDVDAMARRSVRLVLDDAWPAGSTSRVLRLMDLAVPMSARLMFELAFKSTPTREQIALICRSARDSMRSSKGLRHARTIEVRLRLLNAVRAEVRDRDGCPEVFGRDSTLDTMSRAKHLQGVFFHTGVIQLSESVCHTVLAASAHPHAVERIIRDDPRYLDDVLTEALRLYPLHATIQRLVVDDIPLSPTVTVPRGTQLLFDIGRHQRMGHPEADAFMPERWQQRDRPGTGFVGFGQGRRKCPAERFARTAAAAIVRELLTIYAVYAPVRHTRALEGGGLCCLTVRGRRAPTGVKLLVRTRDHAERIGFSAAQLICLPLTGRAVRHLQHPTQAVPPSTSG